MTKLDLFLVTTLTGETFLVPAPDIVGAGRRVWEHLESKGRPVDARRIDAIVRFHAQLVGIAPLAGVAE